MEDTPAPSRPRRLLTKAVMAVYVLAAVVALPLHAVGLGGARSPLYLGAAALLCLAACAAWEIVERRSRRGGLLRWLAFPVAWLAAFAQLPLLALAVYPPLEEHFASAGRVRAYIAQRPDGRRLEIWFPEPVDARSQGNLRLNDTALPQGYAEEHAEHFQWLNERTLSIRLEPLVMDLELGEITEVVINSELTSRPFHYRNGDRVPSQKVPVRPD